MNLREFIQSEIKSQLGESVNEGFKSEYKGNDGIVWKKGKSRGDVTNFTPYYKGHDIDKGGHNFKTEKELKDFIKDYILSNQLYNKYRFESVNEAKKKLPKFKNIPSWAKYLAQHSDGEWYFYEETPTMIKFKDGSGGAWKQDGNQIYSGVKTDGNDWDKTPTYYKVKNGTITESVNEAITDGDVVIFKKQKGEVPKITYNSSRKQFAADFLSHTDYYKNLTDAIEDMQDAGFKIEKHIQTESVNEGKQYKKGDKLKIKLKNGKEFDLTFDSYGRQKGMAFGKFDGDKKPFSLDTIKEEQLDEKYTGNPGDILRHKYDKNTEIELIEPTNRGWKVYQITKGKRKIAYFDKQDIVGDNALFESEQIDEKLITFSNRAPYGQIVFMAGGAGSGKGFAIDNFIDAAGFKVRDVDEMKKALGKLDQLGKVSVDKWFKKYGNKLSTKPPKNNPKGMTEREHIEEFVLGKNLSISDIASDLKNPNNVASLHYIVDTMGLKDKWLINMLKGKSNKETLPNLLFDITAKKVTSITEVIEPLLSAGYNPKNIHLIWVLTNYYTAVEANKDRDRVVPDDILLQTHEGAAKTMWEVLTQIKPKGLEGRIDVILNNRDQTAFFVDDKGKKIKVEPSQQNKLKEAEPIVKGFKSLPIKKQGGGIVPENVWKDILKDWILKNVPKTISLTQDVMKTSKDK